MNRLILAITGAASGLTWLFIDAAVKGAALLLLANLVAALLWRQSAATRHLVWLLTVLALLATPVISAVLPQWRVLPVWTISLPRATETATPSRSIGATPFNADAPRSIADSVPLEAPEIATNRANGEDKPRAHEVALDPRAHEPSTETLSWLELLPPVWAFGCGVLILRLTAARWMLWHSTSRATATWLPRRGEFGRHFVYTDDRIAQAVEAACCELGIRRRVCLMVHSEPTIPVVWGILRCYLLVPATAATWSPEQLRSVLLHELAHIRRHDAFAQLLAQVACALHWFNPLVWFAAWRLSVERERACDDLVLASGVRASTYAGHLLNVVAGYSTARWASSCGLAMARRSSLEGRLTAVLNANLNRRRLSGLGSAVAVAAAIVIAVPIAMLSAAADEPEQPQSPQPRRTAPAVKPIEDKDITFITGDTSRPMPKLDVGDGIHVEIAQRVFHGTDVATTARIRYSQDDHTIVGHDVHIAADAFANREKWALAWVRGTTTLWHVNGGFDGRTLQLSRTSLGNPKRIVSDYVSYYPGEPIDGLDIPPQLQATFEKYFGITDPKVVDKSSGLPEVSGQFVYQAQPVNSSGDVPAATVSPSSPAKQWSVQFVNSKTGESVPAVRVRLRRRTVDRSRMSDVVRVVHDNANDALNVSLEADEYGEVLIEDEKQTSADEQPRYFGNVPTGVPDAQKHTDPNTPLVVKVRPREQHGARLRPATEEKLKWGAEAGGLRMALAWPPSLGEPALGNRPRFYLALQNVSQAKLRLATGPAAPNPRRLILRDHGQPLSVIADNEPMPGDWLLSPGEVALLPLFSWRANAADADKPSAETPDASIEQSIRAFPQYSATAEMTIEKAPAGAWTGKLATAESRGGVDIVAPKRKDSQALYRSWTSAARIDGKIPGGLIGELARCVKTYIKTNPSSDSAPQLEKMLARFDASHDWIGQGAAGLLDEVQAINDAPITMALDREELGMIRTGEPLPRELADAPWGSPAQNGLRLAWLLEPHATEHRLGRQLLARVLIYNSGKEPVVFRTRTWHQLACQAHDAQGGEINVDSIRWLMRAPLVTFRLAPGEYVELSTPGIGIGRAGAPEEWQRTRVASWIEAKAGDMVTVTTAPLPLFDSGATSAAANGQPRWWLDWIKARLSRHLPFPADAEARKLVLYRIAMELFGTPLSKEINEAFVADTTPDALDSLADRLFRRPEQVVFDGALTSAPTTFRVLPPDVNRQAPASPPASEAR
jgi:beta-lactamase regulating signal transducer with metallopeptidase domain